MTSTLKLALADRFEKFGVQSLLSRDEIKLIIAALRAAPIPQCDAECATPARAMQILKEISELPEDLQFYIASALVSPPSEAGREAIARVVYEAFPFDGVQTNKPPWIPNGNSIRQDDARRAADKILALSRPDQGTVAVSSADHPTYCTTSGSRWCDSDLNVYGRCGSCPLSSTVRDTP